MPSTAKPDKALNFVPDEGEVAGKRGIGLLLPIQRHLDLVPDPGQLPLSLKLTSFPEGQL